VGIGVRSNLDADPAECIIRAMSLVLASASPRRRELLAAAGFTVEVDPPQVDEAQRLGEPPAEYVERVARDKAAVVSARHPDRTVIAADTAVLVDGEVLGKPADDDDAARMLRRLSNRAHDVWTGVAVARAGQVAYALERTRVWMLPLSEADVRWYVESGEPRGKAGGYAIQGLASRFVPRIEGSWSNVVGLPVATVLQLLEQVGDPG
jgi:septum formation protein